MSQLAGIVAFMVIFNAFLPFVGTLGVAAAVPTASNSDINQTSIYNISHCAVNGNTSSLPTCTNDYTGSGVAGAILGPIVTFGNFIWGILSLITTIPLAVLAPAWFLYADYGAPWQFAVLYNSVFGILMGFWIGGFISNREFAVNIP